MGDLLICWKKEAVLRTKAKILDNFEDDVGEMKEYIGCRIDRIDEILRMKQPVLLQSLEEIKVQDKAQGRWLLAWRWKVEGTEWLKIEKCDRSIHQTTSVTSHCSTLHQ